MSGGISATKISHVEKKIPISRLSQLSAPKHRKNMGGARSFAEIAVAAPENSVSLAPAARTFGNMTYVPPPADQAKVESQTENEKYRRLAAQDTQAALSHTALPVTAKAESSYERKKLWQMPDKQVATKVDAVSSSPVDNTVDETRNKKYRVKESLKTSMQGGARPSHNFLRSTALREKIRSFGVSVANNSTGFEAPPPKVATVDDTKWSKLAVPKYRNDATAVDDGTVKASGGVGCRPSSQQGSKPRAKPTSGTILMHNAALANSGVYASRGPGGPGAVPLGQRGGRSSREYSVRSSSASGSPSGSAQLADPSQKTPPQVVKQVECTTDRSSGSVAGRRGAGRTATTRAIGNAPTSKSMTGDDALREAGLAKAMGQMPQRGTSMKYASRSKVKGELVRHLRQGTAASQPHTSQTSGKVPARTVLGPQQAAIKAAKTSPPYPTTKAAQSRPTLDAADNSETQSPLNGSAATDPARDDSRSTGNPSPSLAAPVHIQPAMCVLNSTSLSRNIGAPVELTGNVSSHRGNVVEKSPADYTLCAHSEAGRGVPVGTFRPSHNLTSTKSTSVGYISGPTSSQRQGDALQNDECDRAAAAPPGLKDHTTTLGGAINHPSVLRTQGPFGDASGSTSSGGAPGGGTGLLLMGSSSHVLLTRTVSDAAKPNGQATPNPTEAEYGSKPSGIATVTPPVPIGCSVVSTTGQQSHLPSGNPLERDCGGVGAARIASAKDTLDIPRLEGHAGGNNSPQRLQGASDPEAPWNVLRPASSPIHVSSRQTQEAAGAEQAHQEQHKYPSGGLAARIDNGEDTVASSEAYTNTGGDLSGDNNAAAIQLRNARRRFRQSSQLAQNRKSSIGRNLMHLALKSSQQQQSSGPSEDNSGQRRGSGSHGSTPPKTRPSSRQLHHQDSSQQRTIGITSSHSNDSNDGNDDSRVPQLQHPGDQISGTQSSRNLKSCLKRCTCTSEYSSGGVAIQRRVRFNAQTHVRYFESDLSCEMHRGEGSVVGCVGYSVYNSVKCGHAESVNRSVPRSVEEALAQSRLERENCQKQRTGDDLSLSDDSSDEGQILTFERERFTVSDLMSGVGKRSIY